MSPKIPSVSQLVFQVKNSLEGQFSNNLVKGEVINLSTSSVGHVYFSLADKDASLSCVLFRGDTFRNPVIKKIKNGASVYCQGSLGLYPKRGSIQLVVRTINVLGSGDLVERFNELKKKLASKGLFDLSLKRAIPKLPKKVAVITSPTGAALEDFINIMKRRALGFSLMIVPVVVQGADCPASVRSGLSQVLAYNQKCPDDLVDTVVITRGGGSMEDLWGFNDEALAMDIANFPIPVISAIGHQVDYTICDYVADHRSETPSAAAEFISQYQIQLEERIAKLKMLLTSIAKNDLLNRKNKLARYSPQNLLNQLWVNFGTRNKRLESCRVSLHSPRGLRINDWKFQIDDFINQISQRVDQLVKDRRQQLEKSHSLLNALSPDKVLDRGYTMALDQDGSPISSVHGFNQLNKNDRINIKFWDGVGFAHKS